MKRVLAVVRRPDASTLTAVEGQSRPADRVISHEGTWHDAVLAAGTQAADWLWLVEGGVVPEPSALAELLAPLAADGDLPAPALLSSKVLGPSGDMDEALAPWPPLLDRDVAIAAARHRLASLRMARWGSLLVRADAAEAHGPPRSAFSGGADDLEWTVRILRDAPGYLVPKSVARTPRRSPGLIGRPREVRDRLRMLRGPGWVAQEPVWFAFMLMADLAQGAARRAGPAPR